MISAWGRLVNLYEQRLLKLLSHAQIVHGTQFEIAARAVAQTMAVESAKANASSWRAAALKSGKSRKIFQALEQELATGGLDYTLKQIANKNANLITKLPGDVAREISQRAAEMVRQGARPAEVEEVIRKLRPLMTRSRVKLLARTSISTAETNLTKVRSQSIGINAYVWETSRDERVRASHRNLNGVIVFWSDPPAPEALIHEKSTLGHYHSGACPNCRCLALPLADLAEVSWPARCYSHGKITRMTRAAFSKMAGMPIAA